MPLPTWHCLPGLVAAVVGGPLPAWCQQLGRELPKHGKDNVRKAVRKVFARYKSATLDVYSLRGPVARAATQVRELISPEQSEIDPYEIELEIERELECE